LREEGGGSDPKASSCLCRKEKRQGYGREIHRNYKHPRKMETGGKGESVGRRSLGERQ